MEDHISAVVLRGRHFHHGSGGGHYDSAADFALRGMIGDGLRVISCGSADYAALLLFRAEQEDFIKSAALLIGAGHL